MTTEKKPEGERIAKWMARAGVCSRRDAERLIAEGRVTVDNKAVITPATFVTSEHKIALDGEVIKSKGEARMWLFYKPKGIITSHKDTKGRKTVFESLPATMPRVISVGRLDYNTEGLLLLTNDGELARHLELPSTGWIRRYRVRVHGRPDIKKLEALKEGIAIEGITYGAIDAVLERQQGANSWVSISVREGKNREVRKVMEHLGLTVNRLIRISYGPFQLGNLPEGEVKEISSKIIKEQLGSYIK